MAGNTLTVTRREVIGMDGEPTLLDRLQGGDARAQREFFEEHGERVWRLIFRLCGDYDHAHDLTQDTFLRAFERVHTYDRRGSMTGWLSRIALNLLRDDLRRRRRRRGLLALWTAPARTEQAADPLMRDRIRGVVDALSEVERVVVLMHDVEEYTHEEIAQALDIAPGSSRARLSRARARLRHALGDMVKEVRNDG